MKSVKSNLWLFHGKLAKWKSERWMLLISTNMFGNANQVQSGECNQTADQGLKNFTDELCEALLDYINVTSQPDVNVTEEIDSFYFYEVSEGLLQFRIRISRCKLRETMRGHVSRVTCNFWNSCHFWIVKLSRKKITMRQEHGIEILNKYLLICRFQNICTYLYYIYFFQNFYMYCNYLYKYIYIYIYIDVYLISNIYIYLYLVLFLKLKFNCKNVIVILFLFLL